MTTIALMERPAGLLLFDQERNPDTFSPAQHARLAGMLDLLHPHPITDLGDPAVRPLLGRTEVLVTGWGAPRIDATALDAMPRLRLVAHAAGTVKAIIDRQAWSRGVAVTNAVAANAIPVAEYTLAAILFANKQVFRLRDRYRAVRTPRRPWSREAPGLGNYRKTVGIVGASHVGRRVIALLRPFDFRVLLHDPTLDAASVAALGVEGMELDALLAASDLVSLHAPLLPSTRGLIDRRRLALLRDGAVLVNTARGGLVEQAALIDETQSGRIDAVIDVTEPDTLPPDNPLYDIPNVFLTPHIAGAEGPETQRLPELVIAEIERFLRGDALLHRVDAEQLDRLA